jgi:hypothetical protein
MHRPRRVCFRSPSRRNGWQHGNAGCQAEKFCGGEISRVMLRELEHLSSTVNYTLRAPQMSAQSAHPNGGSAPGSYQLCRTVQTTV